MCDTTELPLISYETSKCKQMEDKHPLGNSDLDLNPAPYFQRPPHSAQELGWAAVRRSSSCRMGVYIAYVNTNCQQGLYMILQLNITFFLLKETCSLKAEREHFSRWSSEVFQKRNSRFIGQERENGNISITSQPSDYNTWLEGTSVHAPRTILTWLNSQDKILSLSLHVEAQGLPLPGEQPQEAAESCSCRPLLSQLEVQFRKAPKDQMVCVPAPVLGTLHPEKSVSQMIVLEGQIPICLLRNLLVCLITHSIMMKSLVKHLGCYMYRMTASTGFCMFSFKIFLSVCWCNMKNICCWCCFQKAVPSFISSSQNLCESRLGKGNTHV